MRTVAMSCEWADPGEVIDCEDCRVRGWGTPLVKPDCPMCRGEGKIIRLAQDDETADITL